MVGGGRHDALVGWCTSVGPQPATGRAVAWARHPEAAGGACWVHAGLDKQRAAASRNRQVWTGRMDARQSNKGYRRRSRLVGRLSAWLGQRTCNQHPDRRQLAEEAAGGDERQGCEQEGIAALQGNAAEVEVVCRAGAGIRQRKANRNAWVQGVTDGLCTLHQPPQPVCKATSTHGTTRCRLLAPAAAAAGAPGTSTRWLYVTLLNIHVMGSHKKGYSSQE